MKRMRSVLVVSGIIVAIAILAVGFLARGRSARAGTLSAAQAAALATKYAQTPAPVGWLVSGPTQVNARLMSLGAAAQLKDGRPLSPATKLGRESSRTVWLVFLRGDMTVPNQVAAGKTPSSPTVYHQMAVILDAQTGELLLTSLYPPTHEVSAADALPTVALPEGTGGITLPIPVEPTEAPLPTRVNPGRSGQPERTPAVLPAATSTRAR